MRMRQHSHGGQVVAIARVEIDMADDHRPRAVVDHRLRPRRDRFRCRCDVRKPRLDSIPRQPRPWQHERGVFPLHQHHVVARLPVDAIGDQRRSHRPHWSDRRTGPRSYSAARPAAGWHRPDSPPACAPAPADSPAARLAPRSPAASAREPANRRHDRDRPDSATAANSVSRSCFARSLVSVRGIGGPVVGQLGQAPSSARTPSFCSEIRLSRCRQPSVAGPVPASGRRSPLRSHDLSPNRSRVVKQLRYRAPPDRRHRCRHYDDSGQTQTARTGIAPHPRRFRTRRYRPRAARCCRSAKAPARSLPATVPMARLGYPRKTLYEFSSSSV